MSEAMKLEKQQWIVEGLVSTSFTLVTGKPKSGKSALVQNFIVAALGHKDFLDRPLQRDLDRLIIVGTDPDAVLEYRDRLLAAGVSPDLAGKRLILLQALRLDAHTFDAIAQKLSPAANDLIIFDHLSDMAGDFNSQADVANIFAGIRASAGAAAVIVLAHSSTAVGQNGYSSKKPLGSTVIEGKARWIIHVEKRREDHRVLSTRGNSGRGQLFHVSIGEHPLDFTIDNVSDSDAETSARRKTRSRSVLERRGEQFAWYQANCIGLTKAEASRKLAEQFGDKPSTWANRLTPSNWLGQMAANSTLTDSLAHPL